ncbi:acyltransferase [Limosilactobacillus balticus]|uniref:acyltransferase n=1 Tax=Limosilactobacillus balticus TaxID=2759747 RepID=UPI0022AA7756|nr:acyltransferase [Limosilactobacillus balticus]
MESIKRSGKRQSNIELLRIVLILMIIMLHYNNSAMGGALANIHNGTFPYYFVHFTESLSSVAVNTFILITGYFSYNKNKIFISKISRLVLLMIFWGLSLSLFTMLVLNPVLFTIHNCLKMVKMAISQWFVIIYSILYLLIPYINIIVRTLSKKNYQKLLMIAIFFFYIWPTFYTSTTSNDAGYGIVNFVCLYLIGAYIRKFQAGKVAMWKSLSIYIMFSIITMVFSFRFENAWNYNSIFVLGGAIALFEFFISLKIKYNPLINKLASFTFSVYLINVNGFFNKFLCQTIFHSNEYWQSSMIIFNSITAMMGIYIICICLEFLRSILLDKKIFKPLAEKVKATIKI